MRPHYAALRAGAAHGLEIRWRAFLASLARGIADLPGLPRDHRILYLLPRSRVVDPEARAAGLGWLFPDLERGRFDLCKRNNMSPIDSTLTPKLQAPAGT